MNIKQKCDNEIINTILLTLNYKYTVWIFVYIFHSYIICPTNILARKDFNITIIENWFELHVINSNINRYIVFKIIWSILYKKCLLTISYNYYPSRCKRKFKYIYQKCIDCHIVKTQLYVPNHAILSLLMSICRILSTVRL